MLTYRTGVAGGQAAAAAMAAHLNQKTLPDAQLILSEYYAGGPERRAKAEAALASGQNVLPYVRADLHPELARVLDLEAGALVKTEELANVLGGRTAKGEELEGHARHIRQWEGQDGSVRHRISYMDFCFSVPKAVSVAWMAAKTEAERQSILQAARTANDRLMRYMEREIGRAGIGDGRKKGEEKGHAAWITATHFTSRPTLEITRPDPKTGVVDTELMDVGPKGLVPGDPQLHFHNIWPNVMVTDSGRIVSINRDLLAGRIHEFGAIGQAFLAAELEALGIATALDERTKLMTLPCIPEHVCEEFSKRTKQALQMARDLAKEAGLDWDSLDADRKIALVKGRATVGREGKGDDLADWEAWLKQIERLGWQHETAIGFGPPNLEWTREAKMEHGFHVTRDRLAAQLDRRAVVTGADARLCIAKGMIAAGGTTDATDLDDMARALMQRGVLQDGKKTRLITREVGHGRFKLTTELHRDQEEEVIRLAQAGAADRSRALTPQEIEAAVAASGFDFSTDHGKAQREIIGSVGQSGAVSAFVGAAGVGKTSRILPPLVSAWAEQERDVWGLAVAWRQARALQEAGISRFRCRALQPFLEGAAAGRTKLTANSVVVVDELSQIGTRQLLHLLRLREKIGFQLVMTGDPRQCQSIEAGAVIELLRKALGEQAIPEILSTVRQQTIRAQDIAGLWREGSQEAAGKAIAMLCEDGAAELAPGGYQDAVERVAGLWMERVEANRADPEYSVTITAPTNLDALNIGRAVRERLQARGDVSRDEMPLPVTDGAGNLSTIAVAVGDKVRLYQRTRGLFIDKTGRNKSAHIGDNGSVLRVIEVVRDPKKGGLRLETANGKVGFVGWNALRDRGSARMLLAYGYCLTIDSAQGITSDEHISAMPGGSKAVQAFKGYVQGSRHRVRHMLVGSKGAEMREVAARRPLGVTDPITEAEVWKNVARNLARAPLKELATDMLAAVSLEAERAAKALQAVGRMQQARERAGQAVSTLRRNLDIGKAREALMGIASRLDAAIRERAPLLDRMGNLLSSAKEIVAHARKDREQRRLQVVARMVDRGDIDFGEGVYRLVSVTMRDQARVAPLDPVHQVPLVGEGAEGIEDIEERMEARLLDALDALMAQEEMPMPPPGHGPSDRDAGLEA